MVHCLKDLMCHVLYALCFKTAVTYNSNVQSVNAESCDPVIISMATTMVTVSIIEFIATIAITMVCMQLRNQLHHKQCMTSLQVKGLPLSNILEVNENEAYATTLAHRMKNDKQ